MKKKLTEKAVYEPNTRITVTVDNKPFEIDGRTQYEHIVTVKVKAGTSPDKLTFGTDDDIKEFVDGLNFEDPQTALDLPAPGQQSITDISKLEKPKKGKK